MTGAGVLAGVVVAAALGAGLEPLGAPSPPVWPDVADDGETWREDPDKLRRKWEMMPSPAEYRAALEATGMAAHLATRGPAPRGGGSWQPVGPIGSYGASERNGRISNVEILHDGATYSIYVGACQGGLWTASSGDPDSWTDLSVNLPHYACRAFDVRPSNRNDIVVATGERQRSKGGGVFRTTDGGLTWGAAALPGSTPESCYRLERHLADESVLVLACDEGLLRSTDAGATFGLAAVAGGGLTTGHWTDVLRHPTQPDVLFAALWNTGPFRSTDGGATWSSLASGLPGGASWDRATLALCEGNADVLAAVLEDGGEAVSGVYRSTDGGLSWADVTNGLTGKQAFHTLALAIDPSDSDAMYVGLADLHRTTDAGATWQDSGTHGIEKGHADIVRLYFAATAGNQFLWIANDGGLYVHNLAFGVTFPLHGDSFTGLQCSEMDFHDADRAMRVAGLQDNGVLRSMDAGLTWEAIQGADGADTEIADPLTGMFWFGSGVWGGDPSWRVYRQPPSGSETFTNNPNWYQPRLFHDRWSDTVFMHSGGSLWSTPASTTPSWTSLIGGFQSDPYGVRTLEGSPVDGRTIWINYWADSGNERDLTILKEVSGNWTVAQHHEALNPSTDYILSVTPSPDWPDEAWLAMKGPAGAAKVFHTTDGVTFEDRTGNLSSVPAVWSVAVPPFRPLEAYAGTDFGVFRTTDGGSSWQPFQTGMPAARCRTLSWVVDDTMQGQDRLVVATDGRGMWERVIPSPPIVYVDSRATGFADGTWEYPFATVAAGISAAPTGAIVAVRGDLYAEPQVVSGGDVTLVSYFSKAEID